MNIFINSTACRNSGSLSILKQFISNLPLYGKGITYTIFIDPDINFHAQFNVQFVHIDTRSWKKRVYWDYYGFHKWCKEHAIFPDLVISFQNTGVNIQTPQIIYYHQLLPLVAYNWNPLKVNQIKLFLYKYFYPFFVKRFISSDTHIVVQSPSIKAAFSKRFKIADSQISILKPQIDKINFVTSNRINFNDNCFHFIYPATPFIYKNHIEIVRAITYLKKENPLLVQKIKIHFTFQKKDDKKLTKEIEKNGLNDCFVFEGMMSSEKLFSFYQSCVALLFPSYIETLGLPLIEAASTGLPVIVSDLPYSREALEDYTGACFIPLHHIQEWAKAIQTICENPQKYNSFQSTQNNSWPEFFKLIESFK